MTTPWRTVFLLSLVLFVVSRALTLMSFPIFNDESIYLQYSQLIHADWTRNAFVSMDNPYGDWKPPLQYWLTAPVIALGNDPLLAGRCVSFAVSLLGFFGFYLFAKEIFGLREGVLAAALYACCPPVLFHNNQFIAETFLFSIAPFFYWSILKAGVSPPSRRWLWTLLAFFFATAILLTKQSGMLLLLLAALLPFGRWETRKLPQLLFDLALVALAVIGAALVIRGVLPAEFNITKERFDHQWVLTLRELLGLPLAVWRANLRIASDFIGAYYSWLVPLFVAIFFAIALRRRKSAELALGTMSLAGGMAIVFCLRGFNEYLFNTAVIVTLLPLLARTGVLVWDLTAKRAPWRFAGLALATVMIGHWGYQIALIGISPGRYVRRSTPWAAANYLDTWSTGFGVKEVVELLEKQKRLGVIVADGQWGNPRTALEVYAHRFPNLRIIPFGPPLLDPQETATFREVAIRTFPARFLIFSSDMSGRRGLRYGAIARELCETRREITAFPGQAPIIVCQF